MYVGLVEKVQQISHEDLSFNLSTDVKILLVINIFRYINFS